MNTERACSASSTTRFGDQRADHRRRRCRAAGRARCSRSTAAPTRWVLRRAPRHASSADRPRRAARVPHPRRDQGRAGRDRPARRRLRRPRRVRRAVLRDGAHRRAADPRGACPQRWAAAPEIARPRARAAHRRARRDPRGRLASVRPRRPGASAGDYLAAAGRPLAARSSTPTAGRDLPAAHRIADWLDAHRPPDQPQRAVPRRLQARQRAVRARRRHRGCSPSSTGRWPRSATRSSTSRGRSSSTPGRRARCASAWRRNRRSRSSTCPIAAELVERYASASGRDIGRHRLVRRVRPLEARHRARGQLREVPAGPVRQADPRVLRRAGRSAARQRDRRSSRRKRMTLDLMRGVAGAGARASRSTCCTRSSVDPPEPGPGPGPHPGDRGGHRVARRAHVPRHLPAHSPAAVHARARRPPAWSPPSATASTSRSATRVMCVTMFWQGSGSFAEECLVDAGLRLRRCPTASPTPRRPGSGSRTSPAWIGLVDRGRARRRRLARRARRRGRQRHRRRAARTCARRPGHRRRRRRGAGGVLSRRSAPRSTLDHRRRPARAALRETTGGHGVDLVYDPVGGALAEDAAGALARDGRLLAVGFAERRVAEDRDARSRRHEHLAGRRVRRRLRPRRARRHPRRVSPTLVADGRLRNAVTGEVAVRRAARRAPAHGRPRRRSASW